MLLLGSSGTDVLMGFWMRRWLLVSFFFCAVAFLLSGVFDLRCFLFGV